MSKILETENRIDIRIIPSKSCAHRAYICDFLSGGDGSGVVCDLDSNDIRATKACLDALRQDAGLASDCSDGGDMPVLDCGESGSTLRFMLPLIGVLGRNATFITRGRLSKRPLGELESELVKHGMTIEHSDKDEAGIIRVSGKLTAGEYTLPGSVSSQYITGLLLALPYLDGDSSIKLTSALQSSGYVDITLDVLREYMGEIEVREGSYIIKGGQKYRCEKPYTVEGDWSQAAFWLAAGAIGKEPVCVCGLNPDSVQGDRKVVDVLKSFGAKIEVGSDEGAVTVISDADTQVVDRDGSAPTVTAYPSELTGTTVDVSEIPDLAPAIACVGAAASGETRLVNAGRLRLKESDRIKSIVRGLTDVGVAAEEGEDEIIIHGCGGTSPEGGTAETAGDHRIVMMAAVLSLITGGKVTIKGCEAVSKSYPTFFEELEKAGLTNNIVRA